MATCQHCSAPLLAHTNICQYCNVRNDIDLQANYSFNIKNNSSHCICPHCQHALQSVTVDIIPPLNIERCSNCFGLFFPTDSLETLLQHSLQTTQELSLQKIDIINRERYPKKQSVKYIKCPNCQNFMQRTLFAKKSGVIIDRCRHHGIWLDNGELTHLIEWTKAGGIPNLGQSRFSSKATSHSQASSKQTRKLTPWYNKNITQDTNLDLDLIHIIIATLKKLF